MKKTYWIFFLLMLLSCCGLRTKYFTIDNQSDWDVIVELKKFKELGKYQEKSNYIIPHRNKVVFEIYNSSSCNLISVNGAKVERHNSSEMVLSNSEAKEVSVINLTKKDIFLINLPAPPGSLSEKYVKYYKPIFSPVIIKSMYDSKLSPKKNIYVCLSTSI